MRVLNPQLSRQSPRQSGAGVPSPLLASISPSVRWLPSFPSALESPKCLLNVLKLTAVTLCQQDPFLSCGCILASESAPSWFVE